MEAVKIRKKLQEYIDNGDEKLLKLMYAIAKEYNNDDDFEYEFSENEMNLLEERRKKRLSGDSKTDTWEEAKEIITVKGSRNDYSFVLQHQAVIQIKNAKSNLKF